MKRSSSIPIDITGRDHLLIGTALSVAARALRARQDPPLSDIADMELILATRYSSVAALAQITSNLELALSAGFIPKAGPVSNDELLKWLADHKPTDSNVVPISSRKPDK